METSATWPAILEINLALGERYRKEMEAAAAEINLPSPDLFGLLFPALLFEPEPISPAMLAVRNPYAAPGMFAERLAVAAGQYYFTPVVERENTYFLTAPGKHAARHVIAIIYKKLGTLKPLPDKKLARLASLLARVVGASLAAAEPPGKWCILHSRNTDPGENAPLMVRLDQYLTDLAAYRDDAHLASWQPLGIQGHAWEAFTYLWRAEVETLPEIVKALERRGHAPEAYRQALEGLTQRGWVEEMGGHYHLSPEGNRVRQRAEEMTDQYFFSPWGCLRENEAAETRSLLTAFRDGLRPEVD